MSTSFLKDQLSKEKGKSVKPEMLQQECNYYIADLLVLCYSVKVNVYILYPMQGVF